MDAKIYEQQQRDSDMIFTMIISSGISTLEEAKEAIVLLFLPDPEISRSGISHAIQRLAKHFGEYE